MKPVDESGLPGTIGEDARYDGGDTAAILGTLWAFGQFTNHGLPWHEEAFAPLRHPDKSRWYGQPDRFSRDQLVAVLCGLIMRNNPLSVLYESHRRRRFIKAWNTRGNGAMNMPLKEEPLGIFPREDLTGPEVWSLWLRLYKPWWRHSVLWVLDIETLVGSIHWRLFRKDRVTRNHMLVSIVSRIHSPTLTSRLTYKINDWKDLISRWRGHCEDVREYQTADLFEQAVTSIDQFIR